MAIMSSKTLQNFADIFPLSYEPHYLFLITVTTLIVIAIVSKLWSRQVPDAREPPVLKPRIPLIGHLIGMIQHEAEYLQKLSARQSWPIFTLKIFGARIYVVTTGELAQAVFRNSKAISFDPIGNIGAARVLAIPKEKMASLLLNDNGQDSMMTVVQRAMNASVVPGTDLLDMSSRALHAFTKFLEDIDTSPKQLNLHRWIRDTLTLSSAEGIYGANNPVAANHSLIQSLEDFNTHVGPLFLSILPSLTARSGHLARLAFTHAFTPYYTTSQHLHASALVRVRHEILTRGGMTDADIASFDIGFMTAAVMNSIPGMFWLLCHVYSSPALLDEVREEVEGIAMMVDGEEVTLRVGNLTTDCPLLCAAWQETLRLAGIAVSSRVVVNDVLLSGTYLLKRNAIVQIPTQLLHTDPLIWASPETFNPRRFLPTHTEVVTRAEKKARNQAFRPFGGGSALCPGRHFATMEILGAMAAMVLGFEIGGREGGVLEVPDAKNGSLSVAIRQPEGELAVVIRRREDFEGVRFAFDVSSDINREAKNVVA